MSKRAENFKKKQKLKKLQNLKRQLSWYNPNDDDPTGEFYTVKEQKRSLTEKIRKLQEEL